MGEMGDLRAHLTLQLFLTRPFCKMSISMKPPLPSQIDQVLDHYAWQGDRASIRVDWLSQQGLINVTFEVQDGARLFVLQRLNPVFDPALHFDIQAITHHLQTHGLLSPTLIETRQGALFVRLADASVWRLMTHMAGRSFDTVPTPAHAFEAGQMAARFHTACLDLQHTFHALRPRAHDTAWHLQRLVQALDERREHQAYSLIQPLAAHILNAYEPYGFAALPRRICHGDLKISNLLFDAAGQALCWVDLDTTAHSAIAIEMGDAWRSWCNPVGENCVDTCFDQALLTASLEGYLAGGAQAWLSDAERRAFKRGIHTICLELAARFLRDALSEDTFAWDSHRFESHWRHSLIRAQGQYRLSEEALKLPEELF